MVLYLVRPSIPLLGHLPQFWRDRLGFLVRCASEYGDVVSLRIGKPTLLLTNPDDIKHVLVTHSELYAKTPRLSGKVGQERLGESVLTSLGAEHLKKRRALQPLFHSKGVEIFETVITDAVHAWISSRKSGEWLNIAEEMPALARRIMTRALFGSDIEAENGTFTNAVAVRRRYHEHIVGAAAPLPQYQPARILFQYRKAINQIDALLGRTIQLRRNSIQQSNDMLSRLVHTLYDDGTAMTDTQIRAEALTFIDTGFETIGAALTWTWYLLAQHPHIETKLAFELNNVLTAKMPGVADIPKLRYTTCVFKESLRLYPPTWNFVRTVVKPDVLPCGVEVLPGMKLFLCQYIVHRNPRYFAEPETFKPERFDAEANCDRPRFSYFPFGGGPHVCLGESFAELECILVLAAMAQRLKFELEPNQAVKLNADFALRPQNGIWSKVVQKH